MTINLRAKLSAYSKNALLEQAPVDGKIYARKDGQWVEINIPETPTEDGSYLLRYNMRILLPALEGTELENVVGVVKGKGLSNWQTVVS